MIFCVCCLPVKCLHKRFLCPQCANVFCVFIFGILLLIHAIWFQFNQVFFKENVRNPAWICRDLISLILGTRIGSLKRLKKTGLI